MYWRGESLACGITFWMILAVLPMQLEGGRRRAALVQNGFRIG
jgi:hypothetical protein